MSVEVFKQRPSNSNPDNAVAAVSAAECMWATLHKRIGHEYQYFEVMWTKQVYMWNRLVWTRTWVELIRDRLCKNRKRVFNPPRCQPEKEATYIPTQSLGFRIVTKYYVRVLHSLICWPSGDPKRSSANPRCRFPWSLFLTFNGSNSGTITSAGSLEIIGETLQDETKTAVLFIYYALIYSHLNVHLNSLRLTQHQLEHNK